MLGNFLRHERKKSNLTLRQVEQLTGISNAYLSQLENDKAKKPSPAILHKLAECYYVSYGRLMELAGHPLPQTQNIDTKVEPSFRLDSVLRNLTDEETSKVEEYIAFLKSKREK